MNAAVSPLRICFLIDNLSRAGTDSQFLMLPRGLAYVVGFVSTCGRCPKTAR
jgi:hypothetical protein